MAKIRKGKRNRLFITFVVIIILLAGTGIWIILQQYSTRKMLKQIQDKPFETLIEEALADKKDAVVTVGVIKDGETSYTVYGEDAKKTEQKEYLYEIGSVTKTMTAALIARAVQEERLSLTDSIDQYLKLPEKETYPTIAALLTHTSGLDDYYFEWGMLPYLIHHEKNPFTGITDATIYEEYKQVEVRADKEYDFAYSNYGFALLGLVLEQVYDTDYTELIQEYLQNELDMKDTHISSGDADFEGSWTWSEKDAYIPAGAMLSDISDMLLYASAQLDQNPLFTMCHQSLKQINASDEWDRMGGFGIDAIGMSWMIDSENDLIWHNGGTGLHTSYLGFCPTKNTAVVVLSNLDTEEDIPATTLGFKKLMEISYE